MAKPSTVEDYLDSRPPAQRALLERVRKQIRAAVPGAEEYIGYGMIAFRFEGHPVVYLGAATNHCALYGNLATPELEGALRGFPQSKGSIHFTDDKPLPAALVKALLKAKIESNRARWGKPAPAARRRR